MGPGCGSGGSGRCGASWWNPDTNFWVPVFHPVVIVEAGLLTLCTDERGICEELMAVRRVQVLALIEMDGGNGHGRLPTTHATRIENRDAKMWRRETQRELRTGSRTSRCPCTLCLFGRPLLRTTQAKHLRDYGRHPMRRMQEEVSCMPQTGSRNFLC